MCVQLCACVKVKRALLKTPEEEHLGAVLQLLLCCLPLPTVEMPREEAGYEFILHWDEVINAHHLLLSACCQNSRGNTKRNAAPVGELQTSTARHMMPPWYWWMAFFRVIYSLSWVYRAFVSAKRRFQKTWHESDSDREECGKVVIVISVAVGEDKFDSNCHYFANPFSDWYRIISCC